MATLAHLRHCAPAVLSLVTIASGSALAQAPDSPVSRSGDVSSTRPGLFRVGSTYLTPYLHIGTLGVDTNVLYTPTDRQTDFTASGGPGLEIVRPFRHERRLVLDGGLDYLYFAKTDSQRRLNGYGTAYLDLRGVKTRLALEEKYERIFSRPNYEVNARVEQENEGTRALLRRDLGDRMRVALFASRLRTRTENQDYLGTNLGSTLTSNEYSAGAELQVALSKRRAGWPAVSSPGTVFRICLSATEPRRSPMEAFERTTLLSWAGFALGGMRWLRLDTGADAASSMPTSAPR